MMKPYFKHSILVIILLLSATLKAQQEVDAGTVFFEQEKRTGRFYIIPETSIWFGTYTNITLAPQVGFHLADRLSVGAGPHYTFYKNNDFYSPLNFSTHIWGIKGFSRLSVIRDAAEYLPFYLFDELFLHLEYERMSLENQYFNSLNPQTEGRFWSDHWYAGLGISQRIQGHTSYFIMLLWNLNPQYFSLYRNPTYRIGVNLYF